MPGLHTGRPHRRIIVIAAILSGLASGALADTSIRMRTHTIDFINGERTYVLTPADGVFSGFANSGGVTVNFRSNDFSQFWSLQFAPPAGQPLAPGRYEDAAHPVFRAAGQPGLQINGGILDCDSHTGAFEIKQVVVSGTALVSFWAEFEQSCERFSGEKRGEVRFSADVGPVVHAPLTARVQRTDPISVAVTTEAFPGAVPALSASGGPAGSSFVDAGDGTGTFDATPRFDQAGVYDLNLAADDGAGHLAAATTRLRVGGVTSVVLDNAANRRVYTPQDGELFGRAVVISNLPVSYADLFFRSNQLPLQIQFAGPDGALPAPGVYENVAPLYQQAPGQAGLTIYGLPFSCGGAPTRFEVRQADYGPFGLIRAFWAVFEQPCGVTGQTLRGEVRLNADVPLWMKAPARLMTVAGDPLSIPVAGFSLAEGPLSLSAAGLPAGATFVDRGDGTGRFDWTPAAGQMGPARVTFAVTDSGGETDTAATDLAVNAANDDFERATIVASLPFTDRIEPFWATRAPDDPECGYAGNGTVWYSFTPPRDMTINLDTIGGTPYTSLGVFTGSRGALSQVACGAQTVLGLQVGAGRTYYVMAGSNAFGSALVLSATVAPTIPLNDDFDAATPIPSLPFTGTGNILLATNAPDDPTSSGVFGCGFVYSTVWYSFTPTADVRILADTIGSDFRAVLSVFTGARGSLQLRACDNSLDGQPPNVSFTGIAGQTYYFMIGFQFFPTTGGNLVFNVRGLPPLHVSVSIDSPATLDPRLGTVRLSGTAVCSRAISFDLTTFLYQDGAGATSAQRTIPLTCDGTMRWTASLDPRPAGRFRAGPAFAAISANVYDPLTQESDSPFSERQIVLRPAYRGPTASRIPAGARTRPQSSIKPAPRDR